MSQRLKRWESPRDRGRNTKGKGGSARLRQLKKRQQMLRKRLWEAESDTPKRSEPSANPKNLGSQSKNRPNNENREQGNLLPVFMNTSTKSW